MVIVFCLWLLFDAAQQLKMLSHTCIPQYVDDFEEEGRLFLVQEFIEGQTLTALTQTKGCFTDEEVWFLLNYKLINLFIYLNKLRLWYS